MNKVILPITGMTCANCVATIERNVRKLDGIDEAVVNLVTEKATIGFDESRLSLDNIIARIQKAGYGVSEVETVFVVPQLSDNADALRIEKTLSQVEGVRHVSAKCGSDQIKRVIHSYAGFSYGFIKKDQLTRFQSFTFGGRRR